MIREARDAEKCNVITVNRSWERIPNADVLYAADVKWWEKYAEQVFARFQGECWTCEREIAVKMGICHMPIDRKCKGASQDRRFICNGDNGGYQALELARNFILRHGDQKLIALVGYDMQHTGGKVHWHEDYPPHKGLVWNNAGGVKSWIPHFKKWAEDAKREGFQVWNCTIDSALPYFERKPLADLLL